jgi:NADH-quinone oxidoreductase subunit N
MKVILLLAGLGLITLLAEIFRFKKFLFPIVALGLIGAIATAVSYWWYDDGSLTPFFSGMVDSNHHIPTAEAVRNAAPGMVFASMINFQQSSVVFTVIMLVTTLLWLVMAKESWLSEEGNQTDHYSLTLFALTGAVMLTCYNNMTMLFLGIETLSIPLYVMAGSRKNDLRSNEASFKYFLMGSFASGFLLLGIALVYGATGSLDLMAIGQSVLTAVETKPLLYAGVILMLVGMLFKVSAAPFHFWAPDVYQGAPTPVTAFMSTVVKTAAIVAIMRLFLGAGSFTGLQESWGPLLAICTGLTFLIGNISAVVQNNVKRMLAFSSISHAGFLLLAIVSFGANSPKVLIYYTAAYSIASIAAFTVLLNLMQKTGNDLVESFSGLGKKNPLLALVMTVALLSLAGIPPTAGFFGKYYVFSAAMESGHVTLVILGILGSLIGVYYYFRIIIAMYFSESKSEETITVNGSHQALLFITAVIILVLGLLPDLLLNLSNSTAVVAAP